MADGGPTRYPKSEIRNPKSEIRTCRGFTLIELCLVIALLGILVSVAWPSFQSLHRRYVLQKTVDELTGCMAFARANAVGTQTRHVLKFDERPRAWQLLQLAAPSAAEAEPALAAAPGRCGRRHLLPATLALEPHPQPVSFFPNGATSGGHWRFLEEGKARFSLTLSATLGHVEVVDVP